MTSAEQQNRNFERYPGNGAKSMMNQLWGQSKRQWS